MALHFKDEAAYQRWLAGTKVQQSADTQHKVIQFNPTAKEYTIVNRSNGEVLDSYSSYWFSTRSATDWPIELLTLYSTAILLLGWLLLG